MAPIQTPPNDRRGSQCHIFNTNRRRYSKRPNKQRHHKKDVDGNVAMGGMGWATQSASAWGHQQFGGIQRGNRRRGNRQRGISSPKGVYKSPKSPRPELGFWEKVNWQPQDTPMKDAPAPPSWNQYSYADTNGLRTQIDMEGDVVMGEAPSLALSLLAELMSVTRLQ